jgi:hypothetical protein
MWSAPPAASRAHRAALPHQALAPRRSFRICPSGQMPRAVASTLIRLDRPLPTCAMALAQVAQPWTSRGRGFASPVPWPRPCARCQTCEGRSVRIDTYQPHPNSRRCRIRGRGVGSVRRSECAPELTWSPTKERRRPGPLRRLPSAAAPEPALIPKSSTGVRSLIGAQYRSHSGRALHCAPSSPYAASTRAQGCFGSRLARHRASRPDTSMSGERSSGHQEWAPIPRMLCAKQQLRSPACSSEPRPVRTHEVTNRTSCDLLRRNGQSAGGGRKPDRRRHRVGCLAARCRSESWLRRSAHERVVLT